MICLRESQCGVYLARICKRGLVPPITNRLSRYLCLSNLRKETDNSPPVRRVCVVGSGPSGFYTAKYLLDRANKDEKLNVHVDMLERLPTPFGLVRYGVAPDHPEVKIVSEQFTEVAKNPRFRFFGNVTVKSDKSHSDNTGEDKQDISVAELLVNGYDSVVLAYGAESNRRLGLPGEDLCGVLSAREFVNWYNGHPDFVHIGDNLDLSRTKNVVIIGQGNVALDCARILAKPHENLESTDLTAASLEQLAKSAVSDVHIVGRRGHVQAAFTIKEFRELTRIPDVQVKIYKDELDNGLTPSSEEEIRMKRPLKRITDLVTTTANNIVKSDSVKKRVHVRFLLSPVEIRDVFGDVSKQRGNGTVQSVLFQKCRLEGPPNGQKAVPTGGVEEIKCDLLLTAVGYKSLPLEGVPFDSKTNTIPNLNGRVQALSKCDSTDTGMLPRVYVTGWCKRGPVGIVGSNIVDAKETVNSVIEDLTSLRNASSEKSTDPASWLKARRQGIDHSSTDELLRHVVSWNDHLTLDEEERRLGEIAKPVAKPREKITRVTEMLRIIAEKSST